MGFWKRVANFFGSSKDPGGPGATTLMSWTGGNGLFVKRGTAELFRAYERSPYFRMINARMAHERATALRKHRVLFDGPDDDPARKQIDRTNSLYEVMRVLRRPVLMASGQTLTAYQRQKALALWYGLAGEAYALKMRDRVTGRTVGLVPISPLWVMEVPSRDEPSYLIQVSPDCLPRRVPASDVIPYVDTGAESPYGRGIGAGASLALELDTDDGIAKMSRAIIQNQGTPQGMLILEGADKNDVERAREKWREKFGGPDKAGQIEFARGKAQFISFQTREIFKESIEARKFLRDLFCHVNGISPEVFGILDGSTRDSSWIAKENFAYSVVVPWLEVVTDSEQANLVPEFVANPEDACLGYSSPTPDDKELQVRVMAVAPKAFKGRDARRVGGFAPDPDLDDESLGSEPQVATPTQLPKTQALTRLNEPNWSKDLARASAHRPDSES